VRPRRLFIAGSTGATGCVVTEAARARKIPVLPHVRPRSSAKALDADAVVFELSEVPEGTLVKVTESGFDRIPLARRAEAFRMNSQGWAEQMQNIARYVGETK